VGFSGIKCHGNFMTSPLTLKEEEIMNRNGKLEANPINRMKIVSAIFKLFFLLVIDDSSLNN
jgi:hypothetical protein